MLDADLVFIHGFWSNAATWDRLAQALRDDPALNGLRIHAFEYESPKLRLPGSPTRIPDYDDIAQTLPAYLANAAPGSAPIAIVTHSQGGLILQRFLAWMLTEGRAEELAWVRLIVLLACPNEGSEYLRSIRKVGRFDLRPQASELQTLNQRVGEDRRLVLRQIVNAKKRDARHWPIPVYVYSGRTDNVVRRQSAQSVFPNAEVLPGDHFSILNPTTPSSLTAPTLKRHLLAMDTAAVPPSSETSGQPAGKSPQALIRKVIRDREDKILFSEDVPDVALRPLARSAKQWRVKCSQAKEATALDSPARQDLQICLNAAAVFENGVEQILQEQGTSAADPYMFVSGAEKESLDALKKQLREATKAPAARLAAGLHGE